LCWALPGLGPVRLQPGCAAERRAAFRNALSRRHGPAVTDGASRSRASPPESSRGRGRRHSRGW